MKFTTLLLPGAFAYEYYTRKINPTREVPYVSEPVFEVYPYGDCKYSDIYYDVNGNQKCLVTMDSDLLEREKFYPGKFKRGEWRRKPKFFKEKYEEYVPTSSYSNYLVEDYEFPLTKRYYPRKSAYFYESEFPKKVGFDYYSRDQEFYPAYPSYEDEFDYSSEDDYTYGPSYAPRSYSRERDYPTDKYEYSDYPVTARKYTEAPTYPFYKDDEITERNNFQKRRRCNKKKKVPFF